MAYSAFESAFVAILFIKTTSWDGERARRGVGAMERGPRWAASYNGAADYEAPPALLDHDAVDLHARNRLGAQAASQAELVPRPIQRHFPALGGIGGHGHIDIEVA